MKDSHPDGFVVSAPASSANVGPGFDSIAIALDLRNIVHVKPGSGRITVAGEGAGDLATDATNLVARSFDQASNGVLGEWDLACTNAIPVARGLGSSTAAAACGLVAGWAVIGHEWEPTDLAQALLALDGHPDNAAACACGGVVVSGPDAVAVVAAPPPRWLDCVVAIPSRELETSVARAALPNTYTRATCARAVGWAATIAAALVSGDRSAFTAILERDEVHEPYRASFVPELAQARAAIAHTPAYGATLSGAGTTVAVWCPPDAVDQTQAALAQELDVSVRILHLPIAGEGAVATSAKHGSAQVR